MTDPDIRWKQRLQSFHSALSQLSEGVELQQQRPLSRLEKQGFVKAFEFTHELAWQLMKDYLSYQGNTRIMGSRDATREAFGNKMIADGEHWMEMIQTRNKAVHIYAETIADTVIERTTNVYYPLYVEFERFMQNIADHA